MPIHPVYANAILSGRKTVEFRKRRLAADINTVLIYATVPVQRVIGEFRFEETVIGTPDEIWAEYGRCGTIRKTDFFEYFLGKTVAVAFLVAKTTRYSAPKPLTDFTLAVPQSTIYLPARRATDL